MIQNRAELFEHVPNNANRLFTVNDIPYFINAFENAFENERNPLHYDPRVTYFYIRYIGGEIWGYPARVFFEPRSVILINSDSFFQNILPETVVRENDLYLGIVNDLQEATNYFYIQERNNFLAFICPEFDSENIKNHPYIMYGPILK